MNKRCKLLPVWLAVSAVILIAGIVLFALLGFNTSLDRPAYKTVDVSYNVVVELSEENKKQFLIPRGFAHGFLVLSEEAEFCYKCDDVYHPGDEGGLMWNDPAIGVEWPALEGDDSFDPSKLVLSDKDQVHPPLSSLL